MIFFISNFLETANKDGWLSGNMCKHELPSSFKKIEEYKLISNLHNLVKGITCASGYHRVPEFIEEETTNENEREARHNKYQKEPAYCPLRLF